jgi:predicted RNA methylase
MKQQQLGDFSPELKPGLSQWHTPQWMASRMVEWVENKSRPILDPCAGGGAIAHEAVISGLDVTVCEIDPEWCNFMREDIIFHDTIVSCKDFLSVESHKDFSAVVMNPPFEHGQDWLFIKHALRLAPQVITVLRTQALHGVERFEQVWSKNHVDKIALCVRRPKFGPGNGAKSDFCVVDIRRGQAWSRPELVWW